MKLGSLFDGSGAAPLAAEICGITPVWASEVKPYPIRVTRKNFPDMLHLGDITAIDGAQIEAVDIITGGSPCQDCSTAGSRKGILHGSRSNLFFEMVRVIREMYAATQGKYPRYVVWENVIGALNSNKGDDFLAVVRSFAGIADPEAYVPEPKRRPGRGGPTLDWKNAGLLVGNGWSIAWRVIDAQFFGVPQRRRRLYLVASFGNECAGDILFERTRLSGDSQTGTCLCEGDSRKNGAGAYPADRAGRNVEDLYRRWSSLNIRFIPADFSAVSIGNGQLEQITMSEVANTLSLIHDQQAVLIERNGESFLRRLTELECCRLSGFPDDWEDGVRQSRKQSYEMWGNCMVLPCIFFVINRIKLAEAGALPAQTVTEVLHAQQL